MGLIAGAVVGLSQTDGMFDVGRVTIILLPFVEWGFSYYRGEEWAFNSVRCLFVQALVRDPDSPTSTRSGTGR
jgi:hypothetical protein